MPSTPPPAPELRYGIEQRPDSWTETLLYGWQHTLVDISPFVVPLAIAAGLGLGDAGIAQMVSMGLIAMGLATLLQTTVGNRLPIVQGPSALLAGVMAPLGPVVGAGALWGAVALGGVLEAGLGLSGMVGRLRALLPPVVSGTIIVVIGLSLGQFAARLSVADGRTIHLLFAAAVILLVLFLQHGCARLWGGLLARGAVFFAIWTVGLGLGGLFGEVDWALVSTRPWIAWPTLFPFGGPGFGWQLSIAALAAVLVAYLGSMVESLGDYAATCQVAGIEYEEKHMDRGIFAEGLGCTVAACLGGLPCTSYTQNIGIIATTRVASRVVVQVAAGVLILYGLSPKFGALLVAMPRSVLGGVFLLVCGSIVVSGLQLLQAQPFTARSGTMVGLTLVAATAVPAVSGQIAEHTSGALRAAVEVVLGNGVILGVVIAVGLHLVLPAGRQQTRSAPDQP